MRCALCTGVYCSLGCAMLKKPVPRQNYLDNDSYRNSMYIKYWIFIAQHTAISLFRVVYNSIRKFTVITIIKVDIFI